MLELMEQSFNDEQDLLQFDKCIQMCLSSSLESHKLLEEVEFCKKSDAGVPKRIVLYRVVSNNKPIQGRRLGDSTVSTVKNLNFP